MSTPDLQLSTPPQPIIHSPYLRSLLAGALSGTLVDTTLFPLDTLKTRLQSPQGFFPSGGFRGVYNGIGSAVVGSAPGAAFFFISYESVKKTLGQGRDGRGGWARDAAVHMLAASVGEVAACAVRVPTEVVKQRAQAAAVPSEKRSLYQLRAILDLRRSAGVGRMCRELYRGWGITVLREVPFTMVQFPLWEGMKRWGSSRKGGGKSVSGLESALYGSLSGAVAAGVTTPLDVLKTRLMLAKDRVGVGEMTGRIWREEGGSVFFRGIGPRTMWISIGGAVFLGSYQWGMNLMGGAL